jgi:hypothetical protein
MSSAPWRVGQCDKKSVCICIYIYVYMYIYSYCKRGSANCTWTSSSPPCSPACPSACRNVVAFHASYSMPSSAHLVLYTNTPQPCVQVHSWQTMFSFATCFALPRNLLYFFSLFLTRNLQTRSTNLLFNFQRDAYVIVALVRLCSFLATAFLIMMMNTTSAVVYYLVTRHGLCTPFMP